MSAGPSGLTALRAAAGAHPGWRDHRPLLETALGDAGGWPGAEALTALLPAGTRTDSGHPVRFRDAADLPGVDYERHVHATGEVPTRRDHPHDLANALAWARWPRLKAAINAAHCRALADGAPRDGRRGPVRDALTLFDESGALVVSGDHELLDALARHDWARAFRARRDAWRDGWVFVFGHAVLEKLQEPFEGITVHTLLIQADARDLPADRGEALRLMDEGLAGALAAGALLRRTRELSPLPVAGIPGWWADGPQDAAFYGDTGVFRPPARGRVPPRPLAWPLRPVNRPDG